MILTVEQWIRLHSQTAGKDKVARLLQYLSRFLWYYIEKRKNLRDTVLRLKILENSLSAFRRLLRFGKSIEVLYGALKTLHLSDPVLRMTTTLSRIQQSLYLLYDHLIWLSRAGLLNMDKAKLNEYSNRFWLGAILINLLRDVYEIYSVLRSKTVYSIQSLPCSFQSYPLFSKISRGVPQSRPLLLFIETHQDIFWDTVINFCDLWIPLTALGQTNLSPGFVGLLGTISSFAGLITVVNPLLKLAPS